MEDEPSFYGLLRIYTLLNNLKLCTRIRMSKISIRVFSRSDELYLPSAQYRNCGAVEVQYPWWCFLSYIKREATTFYGIPRCTLSFMQLRKLVAHVMLRRESVVQYLGSRTLVLSKNRFWLQCYLSCPRLIMYLIIRKS